MNNYSSKSDYGGSGLGLLGETLPDTIKIEHVFTLQIPSKWDRPLRRWVDKCLDLSKQYAESFHFIAVGIGSYFFLLGCANIVQAGSSNRSSNNDDSSSTSKKKDKSRSKNSKSKESVASTTATIKGADTNISAVKAQPQQSLTIPKATIVETPPTDSEQQIATP